MHFTICPYVFFFSQQQQQQCHLCAHKVLEIWVNITRLVVMHSDCGRDAVHFVWHTFCGTRNVSFECYAAVYYAERVR